MKERAAPDPTALDVPALCRHGVELGGELPLARMERLAQALAAVTDGTAAWSAQASLVPVTGGDPEMWLALQARADVPLQCQRCLQMLTEALAVERRFRFVRSEEEAAELDEESEDDVLALPPRLDLLALLEDELILSLPIVPRHEVCPQPLAQPAVEQLEEEAAPHPFAALAALRGRSGGSG
jgi:uncharacterized protein